MCVSAKYIGTILAELPPPLGCDTSVIDKKDFIKMIKLFNIPHHNGQIHFARLL